MIPAERLEVQIDGRVLQARDEIHLHKLQVLAKFVNALLDTPEAKQVAKVILYGSVARSEAEADSDIDVLLFTTGAVEPLEQAAQAVTWQLLSTTTEHVAVIVFSINDFYYNSDFFLLSILDEGKEIFTMAEAEIKEVLARNNYSLGLDYIRGAENARANGDLRLAIDAAYDAAELAAKAFLLLEVGKLPTRHGRIVGQFSQVFVIQKQLIPPELGHALNLLLDRRHKARYEWKAALTDDMADAGITLARDLMERLRQFLAETVSLNLDDTDE